MAASRCGVGREVLGLAMDVRLAGRGTDVIDRLDARLGDGLERAISAHHHRRLRRRGRLAALEPDGDGLWARTGTQPRAGNRFEVLIDGAAALPAMADAIAGASRYVHICSWHLEPGFLPLRGERARTVHEKLVIVDGEVAFVGGIDLTSLAGDRFDSPRHAAAPMRALGWHDASTRLHGPIVRDVAAHFALRWEAVTGEAVPLPDPEPAGDIEAQFVRTVPETAYRVLHEGEFSVLEAYVRALRSARRLIYLENQFLWSPEIGEILERKLREPPADDFRLVVLLPEKANN